MIMSQILFYNWNKNFLCITYVITKWIISQTKEKKINHGYTYVPSLLNLHPISIPTPPLGCYWDPVCIPVADSCWCLEETNKIL